MSNLLISRVVEYNVSGTIPHFIYQYKQSLSPKIGPRLYLLRIIDNNLRLFPFPYFKSVFEVGLRVIVDDV